MNHREQRTFTITLHLSADFADEYTGDDDGFAWYERFQRAVRPALVSAVHGALRVDPKFCALAAPRGQDPELALDFDVSFETEPARPR